MLSNNVAKGHNQIMKRFGLRHFLGTLFIGALALSACGTKVDESAYSSDLGFVPEAHLPADVGVVSSYSSRDDEQYSAIQALERDLGDEDRVSETAAETLDAQFGTVGLDFERDLQPAFGDRFRMVYALRPDVGDGEEGDTFTVVTLLDPEQMEKVLKTLATAEQLSIKKLSEVEAYVDSEASIYITIFEDLLFMTNSPENLVGMVGQEKDSSLWEEDEYQDTLSELGSGYVFYGILYPALYVGDVSLPGGFSVSDIPSIIEKQIFVVRAEEKGFRFDAWVKANEDDAKSSGISFDAVPKSEPYLFEEVPAEGLMAYFESYGLQQTFAQADALGDDTSTLDGLREMVRSYFGMDFDEDILTFLDKGYAVVLHQNGEAAIPGMTIFVDVSSNVDSAKEFVNKLDGQLSGLLLVFEQALPGAVTKDTVAWGEETFGRVQIDLSTLPQSSESPLPTALTSSVVRLIYGVEGDRLILSTAGGWDVEGEMVSESELYLRLNEKLTGEGATQTAEVQEGLILVDAKGVAGFAGTLRALREQLNLQVSEEALQLEDFLEGFFGALAKSKTEAYESHFSGFLMLAD